MITDGLLFNLSQAGDKPALTRLAKEGVGIYQIPTSLQEINSPFLNILTANFSSIHWNISVIYRNYSLLKTCSMFLGAKVASKSLPRKLRTKARTLEKNYQNYIAGQSPNKVVIESLVILFYLDTLKELYAKVKVKYKRDPQKKKLLIETIDKQACYVTLFYIYTNLAGFRLYLSILEAGQLVEPIDEFQYYRQQMRVFGKFQELGLQVNITISPKKSLVSQLLSGVTVNWSLPIRGNSDAVSSEIRRVQISASKRPEITINKDAFQALLGKTVRLFDI